MTFNMRGRPSLNALYVHDPSPEVDWEFVDSLVHACLCQASDLTVLRSEYGTPLEFSLSQRFACWLASENTAPSDDELLRTWRRLCATSSQLRGRNLTEYSLAVLTEALAEYAMVRAIYIQLSGGARPDVCFTSLLSRRVAGRGDCDCTVCPGCGVHLLTAFHDGCDNCESCDACCVCVVCTECTTRVSEWACGNCERCDSCGCTCTHCDNCGSRLATESQQCTDCERCHDCCECPGGHSEDRRPRLSRKSYELHKYEARGKQTTNHLTRLLGAEIEVSQAEETAVIRRALTAWRASVVNDGSLPSSGSEIVTQPAAGDNWTMMIGDITSALANAWVAGAVNNKCGLHIHVDAGDMCVWDVKRFIKLYAHVEQAMFDLTDVDTRRCAQYAKPCGRTFSKLVEGAGKGLKQLFLRNHYGVKPQEGGWYYDGATRTDRQLTREQAEARIPLQFKELTTHKYNDTRYRAVNLHSYFYRGTIEFRHHHGTIDGAAITHWGIVCGSLVEWASRHTDAELVKLCVGRSRKKVLEIVVGGGKQQATIDWMRARWNREGTRVSIDNISAAN